MVAYLIKFFNACKTIISEIKYPTKTYEVKDLRKFILIREQKKLAKICDLKKLTEFVNALKPIAALEKYNLWCVLTQAWHESGGFLRVIGNYNYWGIKKPSAWAGLTVDVKTHEYIDGRRVAVVAKFIDFASAEKAIVWYMSLITRLYPRAHINRDNPANFFLGLTLGKCRYATDPTYLPKLKNLYEFLRKNIWLKNLLN